MFPVRKCSSIKVWHRAFVFASVVTVVLIATLPLIAGEPPTYTAKFLTSGLSASSASAINEAGDVVGTSTTGSGGWVSIAGTPAVLLPVPSGAQYTFVNDINDAGVIVGSVGPTQSVGFGKATAWTPNGSGGYTIQVFGTLPGQVHSDATAVNNVGDIIGFSSDGTYRYPVLFSAPGGIEDLSATGVFDPTDINDQRVLIDHSFTCKRLDLDTMIVEDLGVPPGPPNFLASQGQAINESGQVAGALILATSTDCDRMAARYTDGVGWEVFSGCGKFNGASAINDLGDVTMALNVAAYVRFQGTGTFLIEDLIVSDVGHWYVFKSSGPINNSLQMAVPATNDVTGQGGIVLLTPVANPGDLDGDADIDLEDYAMMFDCFEGPAINATPECLEADLSGDGFVDLRDLSILQTAFGGP